MAKQHGTEFLKLVDDSKKRIREITLDDVRAKRDRGDSFHLVDVREDTEWAEGYAEGAIHLGKGVIERDIEAEIPDRSSAIILYCGGGFRSALAAEALQKMGYKNVASMDGGWRAWTSAGLPTRKPSS